MGALPPQTFYVKLFRRGNRRNRANRRTCATWYTFCRVNNAFAIRIRRNRHHRANRHARMTTDTFTFIYFICHFFFLCLFNFCLVIPTSIGTSQWTRYINAMPPVPPVDLFGCRHPTLRTNVSVSAYHTRWTARIPTHQSHRQWSKTCHPAAKSLIRYQPKSGQPYPSSKICQGKINLLRFYNQIPPWMRTSMQRL